MQHTIASRIQEISLGLEQGHGLTVVPVAGPSRSDPAYRLLEPETLPSILVTEISQAGSVPELCVQNDLDVRVFLMDGQELVGAKQNRILNADVLVPARTLIKIPVSCVEQGRWSQVSPQFAPGKAASNRTRAGKSQRVLEALRERKVHDADQAMVWQEVEETLVSARAESATSALHAAYEVREQEFVAFRRSLVLPPEAVGLAVFHGPRFRGLDLFDRNSTLRYFWESLIDSYAIDWLHAPVDPSQAGGDSVSQAVGAALKLAGEGEWEPFPSPGEGMDWRLDQPTMTGSALVWQDSVLLHLQLFPKEQDSPGFKRPRIHRRYGPGSNVVY